MASSMKLLALLALLQLGLLLHAHVSEGTRHYQPGAAGSSGTCQSSGVLPGRSGNCNRIHGSECCVDGKSYPQYRCSPPVSAQTPATLTVNSFERHKDGGGPCECDNSYHDDSELVVALSSGWLRLDGTKRCGKKVRVTASNGHSVVANVVDECDSVNGCDDEHNFEPPCPHNVVDGSPGVWKALGLNDGYGEADVTWSDV